VKEIRIGQIILRAVAGAIAVADIGASPQFIAYKDACIPVFVFLLFVPRDTAGPWAWEIARRGACAFAGSHFAFEHAAIEWKIVAAIAGAVFGAVAPLMRAPQPKPASGTISAK
jgi:hypothetical protein